MATKPLSDAGAQRLGELLHRVGARRPDIRSAVAIARRHARTPGSGNGSQDGAGVALIARVADLLAQRALDHPWKRSEIGKIADTVARITGLPIELVRFEIHTRVARDPRIVALSPPVSRRPGSYPSPRPRRRSPQWGGNESPEPPPTP